jgi:DNA-binding NarL/FixJ family response regulator
MPSNNPKYRGEMREQTVLHILNSGKSATAVAEELRIDTNTACTAYSSRTKILSLYYIL